MTYTILRDENDSRALWDLALVKLDHTARTATSVALSARWDAIEDADFLTERKGQQQPMRDSLPASQPASQPAAP